MGDPKRTRGYRNNNPGNLDKGSPWQGLAKPEEMTPEQARETRFAVFVHAKWGIRAMARVLITYQDKRKAPDGSPIDTIAEIVARWAPPVENDTGAYVAAVDRAHPKARFEALDLHDYADIEPLAKAIIAHELGGQPYDQATIDEGLRLAGIQKPVRSLMRSPAVGGGTIAATATGGAAIVEAIEQTRSAVGELAFYLDTFKWLFIALTLAGLGVTIWSRLRERRKIGV